MCFVPQQRALFRHLNFQKVVPEWCVCTFWMVNHQTKYIENLVANSVWLPSEMFIFFGCMILYDSYYKLLQITTIYIYILYRQYYRQYYNYIAMIVFFNTILMMPLLMMIMLISRFESTSLVEGKHPGILRWSWTTVGKMSRSGTTPA